MGRYKIFGAIIMTLIILTIIQIPNTAACWATPCLRPPPTPPPKIPVGFIETTTLCKCGAGCWPCALKTQSAYASGMYSLVPKPMDEQVDYNKAKAMGTADGMTANQLKANLGKSIDPDDVNTDNLAQAILDMYDVDVENFDGVDSVSNGVLQTASGEIDLEALDNNGKTTELYMENGVAKLRNYEGDVPSGTDAEIVATKDIIAQINGKSYNIGQDSVITYDGGPGFIKEGDKVNFKDAAGSDWFTASSHPNERVYIGDNEFSENQLDPNILTKTIDVIGSADIETDGRFYNLNEVAAKIDTSNQNIDVSHLTEEGDGWYTVSDGAVSYEVGPDYIRQFADTAQGDGKNSIISSGNEDYVISVANSGPSRVWNDENKKNDLLSNNFVPDDVYFPEVIDLDGDEWLFTRVRITIYDESPRIV